EDAVHFTGGNDDTKANADVVDAEHLRVADVAPLSDQGEDGRFRWYLLDDIADIRMDACQVEEAIARNVNECPHISDTSKQHDDPVERDEPDGHPSEVERRLGSMALEDIAELRDLTSRDRDIGAFRTFAKALREVVEKCGVGLVDRDVVDHRKRCGSNAQQVIDVHCHTVD